MTPRSLARVRCALIVMCALSACWTVAIAITGGIVLDFATVTISSRNPRNPAIMALVSGVIAWFLPNAESGHAARLAWQRCRRVLSNGYAHWPQWLNPAVATAVLGVAVQISAWTVARPLWADEEMIALNVRDRSAAGLAGPLWLGQSAPYGWLLLEHAVLNSIGTGEKALRLVPMLFGIGTLVVAVWVGSRWLHPMAAGIFVLLCAVAPWLAHYPVELKHYSADAFWALLLPALAIWAIEPADQRAQLRRLRLWWACATAAHWFSNGGLLVMPACGVLLLAWWSRRRDLRAAVETIGGSVVLLASFTANYLVAIRHTLGSSYLRSYWAGGLPPESSGLLARLTWLAGQLEPLALSPVGTGLWQVFWLAALAGAVLARRDLRATLLSIPITGFALGTLAIVPLLDRLALWMVPALYFSIASLADAALRCARAGTRGKLGSILAAVVLAIPTVALCRDIVQRGWAGVEYRRTVASSHRLDDRAAIRWLMSKRQPGDAFVATRLTLPALWWYGPVDLSRGEQSGGQFADGGRILEASYATGAQCSGDQIAPALVGEKRVLLYLGFGNSPPGFGDLLLRTLATGRRLVADRTFAGDSRAVVIDLVSAPAAATDAIVLSETSGDRLDGCVVLQRACRW